MKNISRIRCSLKRRNKTGNLVKKKKIRLRVKKHLRFEKYVVVLNKRNLMVFYYILINFVAYLIFQEGFSCANVIII